MLLLIITLIPATAMAIAWFVLMCMIAKEDWIAAAYNKVLDNNTKIDKLRQKDSIKREKLTYYHGAMAIFMKIFLGGNSEKEIAKLEKQNQNLQNGDLKQLGIFVMPGYVLLRKFDTIGKGSIHKIIFTKNLELYGKKHAENKTKQLMAKLLSYPIIGVAFSILLGTAVIGFGNTTAGFGILGIGTILILVLVYAMYDEVSDQANKRRDAISRQFPTVVSKLALLVTSGMIMDRAWKETAYSHDLQLYREMQKTSQELDNLVSPEVAFGAFIGRCSTKETAKLASAIIQNHSKGNTEIANHLRNLAREAWLERRHTAKRDAEKANSKLMLPTMLLFIIILIIIMVPIVMNFQDL